jgi:2,3-bisphosphoglycerate-dependent phosphoglycerate mutase
VSEPTAEEFRQTRYAPPPGACEVLLIRHGASMPYRPGEPFPLRDGHGDPALAPEGHEQAELLAPRLVQMHERRPFAALYVTTLQRTAQTIAPFAAKVQMTPEVIPDLREVYLGEWEGGLIRQRMAEYGPIAQRVHETADFGHIPGAESAAALTARTVGALTTLAQQHRDQRIVAVVHGGVIGAVLSHITGGRLGAFGGAENTSLHEIVIADHGWFVRRFNDTVHLD